MEKKNTKKTSKNEKILVGTEDCKDKLCPTHGILSVRGRTFEGYVTKKFFRRVAIQFERMVYIRKYERYLKTKTKLHARLPDCLANQINVGDYIEIRECRPLSKIIHHVVIRKIHDAKTTQIVKEIKEEAK